MKLLSFDKWYKHVCLTAGMELVFNINKSI
jgi:hypothetical protein